MAERAITVEQSTFAHESEAKYYVREARNTTEPRIGAPLSEADVKALIEDGVKVTIRGAR